MPYYAMHGSVPLADPVGHPVGTTSRRLPGPDPRAEGLRFLCGRHGGKLIGLWTTRGAEQFLAIAELPDDGTARVIGAAVCAHGDDRPLPPPPAQPPAQPRATPPIAIRRLASLLGSGPAGSAKSAGARTRPPGQTDPVSG